VDWINLAQDRNTWHAVVMMLIKCSTNWGVIVGEVRNCQLLKKDLSCDVSSSVRIRFFRIGRCFVSPISFNKRKEAYVI